MDLDQTLCGSSGVKWFCLMQGSGLDGGTEEVNERIRVCVECVHSN